MPYHGAAVRQQRLEHFKYLEEMTEKYPDTIKSMKQNKMLIKRSKRLTQNAIKSYLADVNELHMNLIAEAYDTNSASSSDGDDIEIIVQKRKRARN